MNNKQEYKLNLFKPSGEYMGELDVNNLALFLTREGFSNITFDIAAKIDNKTNKRLYDIYDQYEVELILRNKTYRFIITDTPANMNDDGSLTYSYTAVSTDFELTKKHIFHWEGIKKYTYWRRVDYKTAGQPFGPQIITPINLQKIDGVFDSQEVEIYEVRKTAEQERESLLVDMTGIELNHNQMGEGTFVILDEGGVAKAKIAPFSESRKEQIPLITEIYYKVYDKIAFADSSIEYNELLNKYQFDNAEFYSTPTGETKEFDGLLYQEEEYYTTIGVTIKDIVDGTIHKDTEWKVNINEDIAEEKRSDIEINNLNAYQLIETIAKSFDVVFVVDSSNREISFYKKYDDIPNTIQNNLVIDFQTYLKAISKDITTDEVVTNIIASGSDGISTTFVSPTGRNWENYDYYLDSYLMFREDGGFLEHNTNIETITDIKDLKFTYTKDFSSRWLSHGAAEKLSLWSITKDYFYRLLNNLPQRADTSKITGNDIYRNLAERREKLLKELVLNETKADQYYAQELHYKNLATIVDNEEIFNEEDLKDTNSETYARYLKQNERSANYLKISNENKLSKERFEKSIQELEYLTMGYHKEIYDSNPPRGTNVYKLMEDLRILFDKENPDQWNFTQKELKEIEKIKKDALWNDDSIDNEVDLFLAANDYLLENNKPKVTISIDIVDILAAAEVEIDKDNLFLGNYIYVRFEEFNIDTKAQISSLNINFEENTIDMEITTLKHFSKGIAHKIIQKINGLSVESKNITEYYKDYNKRSGEESKKLADIFGDDYNADTNTISGGGTGVDEKGNPVHDIVINGEGIKTSNMKIDAATDNIIIDTDAGTTIQLKNGMLGLVGKGKQGDQEIKTRVMMSTTQGFRIDVMKEDELGYQSVDNKFWADLNGNLTVKGRIYATGGKIGNLTIEDIDKIPTALEDLGEGIESSKGEALEAVGAEKERAEQAEKAVQDAVALANKLAKDAEDAAVLAEELAKEAQQAAASVQGTAEGAAATAGEAKRTASKAATDAEEADKKAKEAAAAAKLADEKAKAADEKAKAAAEAAELAATTAGDAKTTAEGAATTAGDAKTTAGDAKTAADQAVIDAASAQGTANQAVTDAEKADKKAQAASEAAELAQKAAEQAQKDLEDTLAGAQIKGDRIAGWLVEENRFSAKSTDGLNVSLDSGTLMPNGVLSPYRIWAGHDEAQKAPFSVQSDGTIYATKGKIGNLTITDNILEGVEGVQEALDEKIKAEEERAKIAEQEAQAAAKEAERLAGIAQAAAALADQLAEAAQQAAASAQGTAEGAATTAGEAKETAVGAVTTAGEAKGTASKAATDAETAKTSASQAATAAGQSATAAEKADKEAKAAAEAARLADEQAKSAAEAAAEADKEAKAAATAASQSATAASQAAEAAGQSATEAGGAKTAAEAADEKAKAAAAAAAEADKEAKAAATAAAEADKEAKAAATAASQAAAEADGAKTAASQSATAAGQAATEASGAKTAANQAAIEASGAKTAAEAADKKAGQSATAAGESAAAASGSKTAAEAADKKAGESAAAAKLADEQAQAAAAAAKLADEKAKAAAAASEAAKAAAEKAKKDLEDTLAGLEIDGKTIAGWTTAPHRFSANSTGGYGVSLDSGTIINGVTTPYRIWAGAVEGQSAPFSVQSDGTVRATKAEIQGKVTIDNGSIMIGGVQTSWFEHSESGFQERYFYVDSFVIDGLTMYRWLSDDEANNGNQSQYLLTEKRNVGKGDVVWGFQMIDNGRADGFDYRDGDPAQRTIINVSQGQNYNFVVDENGIMNAKGVVIEGKITATEGKIGGFNMDSNYLWSGTKKKTSAGYSEEGITFFNGQMRSPNFYIDGNGKANFRGYLEADSGKIGDLYINTLSNIRNINSGQSGDDRRGLGFNTSYSYSGGTLKYFAGLDAANLMLERESNDEGRISTHLSYYGMFVGRGAGSSATPWMSMDLWGLKSRGLMDMRSGGNLKLNAKSQLILSTENKGQIFLSNDGGKELTTLRNPNSVAGWTGFSTKAIKKDIENFENDKALQFIENMKIYEFNYSNSHKKGISFLIEDELLNNNKKINNILFEREYSSNVYIKELLPEWLKDKIGTEDLTEYDEHHYSFNPLTFDFTTLNGILIASIKELSKRVKELESKLNI